MFPHIGCINLDTCNSILVFWQWYNSQLYYFSLIIKINKSALNRVIKTIINNKKVITIIPYSFQEERRYKKSFFSDSRLFLFADYDDYLDDDDLDLIEENLGVKVKRRVRIVSLDHCLCVVMVSFLYLSCSCQFCGLENV